MNHFAVSLQIQTVADLQIIVSLSDSDTYLRIILVRKKKKPPVISVIAKLIVSAAESRLRGQMLLRPESTAPPTGQK